MMSDDGAGPEESSTYDVIVVGTGLVEAMVSCAAAKAGKRVLHLDEQDVYGSQFATYTYASLNSSLASQRGSCEGTSGLGDSDSKFAFVDSAAFQVVVLDEDSLPSSLASGAVRPQAKSSSWHPAMAQLLKSPSALSSTAGEASHPAYRDYSPERLSAVRALAKDREFNFSLYPKVLLSMGKFIDVLIHSGVSRYLEFKALDSVYFHLGAQEPMPLWKVPCSKNDIFNSKQLSALEKRALMKFHQMVADWGRARAGTDVKALNELELAVGRSLYRPQNKQEAHAQGAPQDDDKPFGELMESFKLSGKLQALIQFGLCFHAGPVDTAYRSGDALRDLSLHINSLGRYSDTALLACMYGVGEMVQGFCRMSAVWGGTFVLRRPVVSLRAIELEGTDGWEVRDAEGGVFTAPAVVIGGHHIAQTRCLPRMALLITALCTSRVLDSERSIAVLPPHSSFRSPDGEAVELGNRYAVRVLQSDADTSTCPDGMSVLTVHTLLDDPDAEKDDSLRGWHRRARGLEVPARALAQSIRAALLHAGRPSAGIFKFVAMLVPLAEPAFHSAHGAGSSSPSVAVTGTSGTASLHLEEEVEQAEAIAREVLGMERLFEDNTADEHQGEHGEAAADDDELHMLSQALQLAGGERNV